MKCFARLSVLFVLFTLLAAKCELPNTEEYAGLTKEMSQSVRQTATQTIELLGKGYYSRKVDDEGVDASIIAELAVITGREPDNVRKDYVKILTNDWKRIFSILEQMVAYADALASVKKAGQQGKESFEKVANALSGIASVAGFGTVTKPIGEAGALIYAKIAVVRASKKIGQVVGAADDAMTLIAENLDASLRNMIEINDVAKSEVLANAVHNPDGERILNYYRSLVDKEHFNIDKLTLLNIYDNGDRSALQHFVYSDPQSLDKLGLTDLKTAIAKIQGNAGMSPREKLAGIKSLVEEQFQDKVDGALSNQVIINNLRLDVRLKDIQSDLEFVRSEKVRYTVQYDSIMQLDMDVEKAWNVNKEFIDKSRKLVDAWETQHHNMKNFFNGTQSLSFASIKQYVEDIRELRSVIKK